MIGFASGPMGPEANNLNPTTFLNYTEDRKIAVGTQVTQRPPHRSERAQLRHSAPTSGA